MTEPKPFVNVVVHAVDASGAPTGEPLYSGDEERARAYADACGGVVLTPTDSDKVVAAFRETQKG